MLRIHLPVPKARSQRDWNRRFVFQALDKASDRPRHPLKLCNFHYLSPILQHPAPTPSTNLQERNTCIHSTLSTTDGGSFSHSLIAWRGGLLSISGQTSGTGQAPSLLFSGSYTKILALDAAPKHRPLRPIADRAFLRAIAY